MYISDSFVAVSISPMPFLVDFVSVVHSFYGVVHFSVFYPSVDYSDGILGCQHLLYSGYQCVLSSLSWETGVVSFFP